MDQNNVRIFLGTAIEYGVKCVMKNNFLPIGGKIFRQKDGVVGQLVLTLQLKLQAYTCRCGNQNLLKNVTI